MPLLYYIIENSYWNPCPKVTEKQMERKEKFEKLRYLTAKADAKEQLAAQRYQNAQYIKEKRIALIEQRLSTKGQSNI